MLNHASPFLGFGTDTNPDIISPSSPTHSLRKGSVLADIGSASSHVTVTCSHSNLELFHSAVASGNVAAIEYARHQLPLSEPACAIVMDGLALYDPVWVAFIETSTMFLENMWMPPLFMWGVLMVALSIFLVATSYGEGVRQTWRTFEAWFHVVFGLVFVYVLWCCVCAFPVFFHASFPALFVYKHAVLYEMVFWHMFYLFTSCTYAQWIFIAFRTYRGGMWDSHNFMRSMVGSAARSMFLMPILLRWHTAWDSSSDGVADGAVSTVAIGAITFLTYIGTPVDLRVCLFGPIIEEVAKHLSPHSFLLTIMCVECTGLYKAGARPMWYLTKSCHLLFLFVPLWVSIPLHCLYNWTLLHVFHVHTPAPFFLALDSDVVAVGAGMAMDLASTAAQLRNEILGLFGARDAFAMFGHVSAILKLYDCTFSWSGIMTHHFYRLIETVKRCGKAVGVMAPNVAASGFTEWLLEFDFDPDYFKGFLTPGEVLAQLFKILPTSVGRFGEYIQTLFSDVVTLLLRPLLPSGISDSRLIKLVSSLSITMPPESFGDYVVGLARLFHRGLSGVKALITGNVEYLGRGLDAFSSCVAKSNDCMADGPQRLDYTAPAHIRELKKCYDAMEKFGDRKGVKEIRMQLAQKLATVLRDMHARSTRQCPVGVYIWGLPAIGKSTMLAQLFAALLHTMGVEVVTPENIGRVVVSAKFQDYLDTCNRIVVAEELFNRPFSETEAPILNEILRMASPQSSTVDKAALEAKGSTYFNAEYFIITGNSSFEQACKRMQGVLVDVNPMRRRFFDVEVRTRDGKTFKRDPDRPLNMDAWLFYVKWFDTDTSKWVERDFPLSFREFIVFLIKEERYQAAEHAKAAPLVTAMPELRFCNRCFQQDPCECPPLDKPGDATVAMRMMSRVNLPYDPFGEVPKVPKHLQPALTPAPVALHADWVHWYNPLYWVLITFWNLSWFFAGCLEVFCGVFGFFCVLDYALGGQLRDLVRGMRSLFQTLRMWRVVCKDAVSLRDHYVAVRDWWKAHEFFTGRKFEYAIGLCVALATGWGVYRAVKASAQPQVNVAADGRAMLESTQALTQHVVDVNAGVVAMRVPSMVERAPLLASGAEGSTLKQVLGVLAKNLHRLYFRPQHMAKTSKSSTSVLGLRFNNSRLSTVAHVFAPRGPIYYTKAAVEAPVVDSISGTYDLDAPGQFGNHSMQHDLAVLNVTGVVGNVAPLTEMCWAQRVFDAPSFTATVVSIDVKGDAWMQPLEVSMVSPTRVGGREWPLRYVTTDQGGSTTRFELDTYYYADCDRLQVGDCGALLVAHLPGDKGLLVGQFVAVSPAGSRRIFAPIYRGMVRYEDAMGVRPDIDYQNVAARLPWLETDPLSHKSVLGGKIGEWFKVSMPGAVLGTLKKGMTSSRGTVMKKTRFHDAVKAKYPLPDFMPATTERIVDPELNPYGMTTATRMYEGISGNRNVVSPACAKVAVTALFDDLMSLPNSPDVVPYDWPCAINGVPGSRRSSAVVRGTSAGPGLVGKKKDYMVDAKTELHPDGKALVPKVQSEAEWYDAQWRAGKVPVAVAKMVHKLNEVRKRKKIMSGGTRPVFVWQMSVLIASRRYLLPIIEWLSKNWGLLESCVGLNAHSNDWAALKIHVESLGKMLSLDVDFSHFDMKQFVQMRLLVDGFFVWVAKFKLGYAPQDVIAVICCLFSVIFVVIIINGDAVVLPGIQCSGGVLTTDQNSLYARLFTAVVLILLLGATCWLSSRRTRIREHYYGDDTRVSVAADLVEKLPFDAMVAAYALNGAIATAGDKSDHGSWVPYDQTVFLKRGVRVCDLVVLGPDDKLLTRRVVLAPLALESMLKALAWFEPSDEVAETVQLEQTICSVHREAWVHGEEFFEDMCSFLQGCLASMGSTLLLPSSGQMAQKYLSGELASWAS